MSVGVLRESKHAAVETDFAVVDDQQYILNRGDVCQRIAVDHYQVGLEARPDGSCALLDSETFRAHRGRRFDGVHRRHTDADQFDNFMRDAAIAVGTDTGYGPNS